MSIDGSIVKRATVESVRVASNNIRRDLKTIKSSLLDHLKEVFSPQNDRFFAELHCEFFLLNHEVEDGADVYFANFAIYVVFQKTAFGIANQKFENDLDGAISKEINRAFVDIHMNHDEMTVTLESLNIQNNRAYGIEKQQLVDDLREQAAKSAESVADYPEESEFDDDYNYETTTVSNVLSTVSSTVWAIELIRPDDYEGRLDTVLNATAAEFGLKQCIVWRMPLTALMLLDGQPTDFDLEEVLFERFEFFDPSLITMKQFDGVLDLGDSPTKYNISVNVILESENKKTEEEYRSAIDLVFRKYNQNTSEIYIEHFDVDIASVESSEILDLTLRAIVPLANDGKIQNSVSTPYICTLDQFNAFLEILERLMKTPFRSRGLVWRYVILKDWTSSTYKDLLGEHFIPEKSLDLPDELIRENDDMEPISFEFALTFDAEDKKSKSIYQKLENVCRAGEIFN